MEIKISKCASQCSACLVDFIHEQKVHSVVTLEEQGLTRQDYCASCHGATLIEGQFCYWSTQYADPHILESERQESFSPLRRLFYDAASSSERADLAQAFLAGQLLKRQKVFRQIRESDNADGEERIALYLDRVGNRLIETRDLNFSYAELDEARIALLERLRVLEAAELESGIIADASNAPDASDSGTSVEGEEAVAESDSTEAVDVVDPDLMEAIDDAEISADTDSTEVVDAAEAREQSDEVEYHVQTAAN